MRTRRPGSSISFVMSKPWALPSGTAVPADKSVSIPSGAEVQDDITRMFEGGSMERSGRWPTIHAERTALASDLAGVSTDQWSTPSLCSEWTVRDVLAHLTAIAKITPLTFFPKLLSSGLSLKRLQQKDIAWREARRLPTPLPASGR